MVVSERTGPTIIAGKTYTLSGSGPAIDGYYRKIGDLADRVLERYPDIAAIISLLERLSRKKRLLRKEARSQDPGTSLLRFVLRAGREVLAPHTAAVGTHLAELSLLKRFDAALFTSEEQYHVFMLLIELMNRAWGEAFRTAHRKVAFLPYCLRDLSMTCSSAPGELDHICRGCSRDCYVNRVSTLLRSAGIEPYLWMNADLR